MDLALLAEPGAGKREWGEERLGWVGADWGLGGIFWRFFGALFGLSRAFLHLFIQRSPIYGPFSPNMIETVQNRSDPFDIPIYTSWCFSGSLSPIFKFLLRSFPLLFYRISHFAAKFRKSHIIPNPFQRRKRETFICSCQRPSLNFRSFPFKSPNYS